MSNHNDSGFDTRNSAEANVDEVSEEMRNQRNHHPAETDSLDEPSETIAPATELGTRVGGGV